MVVNDLPISKLDLDTPALVLDADIMERNIAKMAAFARDAGVSLRPHCKTHKSPIIAAKQVAAGAIGITCQKLGEAEVMIDGGIDHILIANQIVGRRKIERLVELAGRADVMVAVDDARNVADLSPAATAAGVEIGVLVEVDTGMGRCGVPPGEPALDLAEIVSRAPGVRFRGMMGYEGHTVLIDDRNDREHKAKAALELLVETVELLRRRGLAVPIVSSSGTGTFDIGGGFPGITEIQVGSYATMDGRYCQVGVPFENALTVLATVISRPREGIAIADAGVKSITIEFGLPQLVGLPGSEVVYLSEEHAKIRLGSEDRLEPGDKIEFLPMHGCTTINLHDRYHVVREGVVDGVWPVAARGRSQ